MSDPRQVLRSGDALIVVDVQIDFCPGGALPIEHGDEVVPVLNHWIAVAAEAGLPICASRDWHPRHHLSFRESGGEWPVHCVQDSPGARFHPELTLPLDALVVTKGVRFDRDQYSAFDETGLATELRKRGVRRVWIGGLAQDVCVRATVLDARREGFDAIVIADATRPVTRSGGARANEEMRQAGACFDTTVRRAVMASTSLNQLGLFTDLYELTMLQAYLAEGMTDTAVFTLFVRRLPEHRNFLLACGLQSVLTSLEQLRFTDDDLAYLRSLKTFSDDFLTWLRGFAFTGDVDAVPEGTPVFGNEPILEIAAPIVQAQLVETLVMNQIHVQTVLASKGARVAAAARGKKVVDFGARRTHGVDAALLAARAFYIAGIDATSNVLAGKLYGIPVAGTMAHSYIQAHGDEREAFRAFAKTFPGTTLLVDTYDTLEGVQRVIDLMKRAPDEVTISAVRLDSGDLGALARETRRMLDAAGLKHVGIFASSGLDEWEITKLLDAGAPIDGFGVGTGMGVSDDAPALDIAYKLSEYGGEGRTKLSRHKHILPGRKQIFRQEKDGKAAGDVIARAGEQLPGRALLRAVMRGGRRTPDGAEDLQSIRRRAVEELAKLPAHVTSLQPADPPYPVRTSTALEQHHEEVRNKVTAQRV